MKKLLSIILAITIALSAAAGIVPAFAESICINTYYIDSISGNDSNCGLSPEAAWKTVSNITAVTLNPGDSVLFRCDGSYDCALTLTCSGNEQAPVVIASYGEGAKPVLTTEQETEVLRLFDCSYITVKDIEITAHNGGGIWIDTLQKTSFGITVNNVDFHDIQNYKVNSRDSLHAGAAVARACIMIKGLPARSRYAVNNLTVTCCEMYDCGNGISIWGSWNDEQTPWCEDENDIDPVYNEGVLVSDCYFHDMDAEAVIVGMCDGALITDCRAINCCQGEGTDENGNVPYYTAAMWFWGSENSTIQYCEIAGQKNVGDGMAVDFDSHSNNCTYQYIYSHDNTRFMCNCPNYSGHYNNTVRYCLSVNDNKGRSRIASGSGEHGFRFYNNTIINCGEFQIMDAQNALIVNNIISPAQGFVVACELTDVFYNNIISNNCYYGSINPATDLLSLNVNPCFSGDDYSSSDSFTLAKNSPLIGKGREVEDELTVDFFGNKITSNNIGCYSGEGTDATGATENICEHIIRIFRLFKLWLENQFSNIKREVGEWLTKVSEN